MSKKEITEAIERIRSYMEQQNRPYSVNDIFMNLHKEIGKTACQKAIDQLVSDGVLREKSYGKQKVYVYDQNHFPSLDEEQLKAMDARIVELTEAIKEKEKLCSEVEVKLRGLSSSLTTEEAQKKIAETEVAVETMQKKLKDLQENQVLVSKEEKDKVNKDSENMLKMWRKRRRMTVDILDAIMEGYPKTKKVLYEEIGIETDEDVGITMPKM
ncbi:PSMC3 interacting protein [Halocaridina rubra]|uniref:Homologous-pairing protein 2 homolog n=1 Tax=Halocaridina rubra TaxID=373956 RepID=A0AAN8XHZ2_HALRR